MTYFPKSQIKENQFTPGAEWYYVKNNSSYTGFYYVLSNGKAYTGKNPNNPPNEEITKNTEIFPSQTKNGIVDDSTNGVTYADNWDGFTYGDQIQNTQDVEIYGILTDTDYNLVRAKPQYSPTFPTPEDYEKGMFVRYFVCKINQLEYLEINKETYDNIFTQNKIWYFNPSDIGVCTNLLSLSTNAVLLVSQELHPHLHILFYFKNHKTTLEDRL